MEQENRNEKQEVSASETVELTAADGKKKKIKDSKYYVSTRKICYVALFTALNIVMSSSICSIPVPGGHLYLNDIVICLAALVLDPLSAFIVGGVGAFFGDMLFYPTPMFVSLATHGLQAVAPGGSFFAPYNCRIFQIKIDLFPAFIDSPVKLSGIARKFRKRKGSFQPDTHAFSQTVQCFFFSCTFDISNGIFF